MRAYKYKLTLEQLELADGAPGSAPPLELEFTNHDELFNIVERIRQRNLFDDPDQAAEFALGLKMFGEVMLKNRDHELFSELAPAFREFMKKLKQSGKAA